jgi:hypothetical protein
MDTFDLRKYLANNPLLNEGLIFEAISDDEIEKAAAAALNVSVDDIPDQEPTEEEKAKVDEVSATLLITIAGLIPPALNLVGSVANKAKQMFGLSDQEQKELEELEKKIEFTEDLIEKSDKSTFGTPNAEERQARARLERLKKEKDEKFGTKIGNWAKHAGHDLHEFYTSPIRKMLQFVAWTAEKFGKKTKLQDEKYREKLANIIYATTMLSIAGFGVATHIKHLAGVGPVLTTLADGVKAGKSVVDIVKDAALSI